MNYLLIGLMAANLVIIFFVFLYNTKQKAAMETALRFFQNELTDLKIEIDLNAGEHANQLHETAGRFATKIEMQVEGKLAEWDAVFKSELKEGLNNLQTTVEEGTLRESKQVTDALRKLSDENGQHIEQKLTGLTNSFSQQLEKKLTSLHMAVQEGLEHYLIQEDEEAKQWLLLIQSENNDALAIQQLESAMNNFPGNSLLVKEYSKRIEPFLMSSNKETQKSAIERYNRVSRAYLDNCKPEEWDNAKKLHNEALTVGNLYMKNRVELFKSQAEKIINELEELVIETELTESQLRRVEELDQQISKELLKNHEDLNQRYLKVTNRLFELFSPDNDEEKIRSYNLEAVEQIKRAQALFTEKETYYKQGRNLRQLAKLLGSWDNAYLTPATQLYFQNVYSDIFSKLNAEHKPKMTELMLLVDKEKVSA